LVEKRFGGLPFLKQLLIFNWIEILVSWVAKGVVRSHTSHKFFWFTGPDALLLHLLQARYD